MKIKLDREKLPRHVAFIMDGNGRWAKRRLLPREFGHREGVKTVAKIVEYSMELGIGYLTFYAFSTENWKRPKKEVDALLSIFRDYLSQVREDFYEKGIRVRVLGELSAFHEDLEEACRRIVERTADRTGITVNIALNYGGRDEIVRAVSRMQEQGLAPTEENLSSCLDTAGQPDPDLLVRPGGRGLAGLRQKGVCRRAHRLCGAQPQIRSRLNAPCANPKKECYDKETFDRTPVDHLRRRSVFAEKCMADRV